MKDPKCAKCSEKPCRSGITEDTALPPYCPITNFKDLIETTKKRYQAEEIHSFYLQSTITEKECYDRKAAREEGRIVPLRPRIREIAEFGKKIGATKLGIAFCSGLSEEANRTAAILEKHNFDVVSVVCSCGAIDKNDLGVPSEHKIWKEEGYEAACNPLLQAEILNRAKTDFNIIIGLCVGHDMLFTRNVSSPVTTLIVKDRFTGHNPVISLYARYHKDIV